MKIPVDECLAGPEMDAAVAEAAGWFKNYIYDNDGFPKRTAYVDPQANYKETVADITTWHPSTDIAAAWELAEKMRLVLRPSILRNSRFKWIAGQLKSVRASGLIEIAKETYTEAETAPLAICRVFFKANGVEFVEVPEEEK